MNRGRMETEHSRLIEVYVKFFEICQDANTGWVRVRVRVSNISDWEDEDSVEWLSSIEGNESLARKTVSFIWRELIVNISITWDILVYRCFVKWREFICCFDEQLVSITM